MLYGGASAVLSLFTRLSVLAGRAAALPALWRDQVVTAQIANTVSDQVALVVTISLPVAR